MNERVLTLYKRKIAIANIIDFAVVTLLYFAFNKLGYRDIHIMFFITFCLIFILSNITKVQSLFNLIFPSMKELYDLENTGVKEEPRIRNKVLIIFIVIYFIRIFESNSLGLSYAMNYKMYIMLLMICLTVTNFSLRKEYKSIFNYKKS